MNQPESTLGSYLRELRIDRQLTQRELSRRTGVCFKTISAIEKNRRRGTLADLQSLATGLGVEPVEFELHPGRLHFHSPLDHIFRGRRRWTPRAEREGVQRCRSLRAVCPEVLHPLLDAVAERPDGADCMRMLSLVATDSSGEWLVALQRLAAGDYPTSLSPLAVNFRRLPVVDSKFPHPCVGDCLVPGIAGEIPGLRYLMLFHVSVSTPVIYTLDMLLILHGAGHRREFDLEIDGTSHRGWRDRKRKQDLKMREIRFTDAQVLRADFNAVLLTTLSRRFKEAIT